MKLLFNISIIIFISFFISACTSKKLTIKSLHPSKIEKEKIHSIKIEDFFNDTVNQKTSLKNKIVNKTIDNQKIFIVKDTIFGVDAILNGKIINSSMDYELYYKSKIDYSRCRFYRYDEKTKTRHCLEYAQIFIPCENRKYNVTTNIEIKKTISNIVIFSKTYDKSSFENICFDFQPYAYPFHRTSTNTNKINTQIANEISKDILDDISPHYVYYDINIIEKLDEDNLKFTKEEAKKFEDAVIFIENQKLDLAKDILEKLNNNFDNKSSEIFYNLALIYESNNQLQIANELYIKAKNLTLNTTYLDLINYAIKRTKQNLEEKIKAKSQLP
uniref:hypothetical protein n=1 Tax=Aliarcobacter sp. TaxID=2321116 RepID=UPI0040470B1F